MKKLILAIVILTAAASFAQGTYCSPTSCQPTVGAQKMMWKGHFTSLAYDSILLYFPSNGQWWLGDLGCVGCSMVWNRVNNNSPAFGTGPLVYPFFQGHFDANPNGLDELKFFGGTYWWIGTFDPVAHTLTWRADASTPTF